jgi:hypothetical protein
MGFASHTMIALRRSTNSVSRFASAARAVARLRWLVLGVTAFQVAACASSPPARVSQLPPVKAYDVGSLQGVTYKAVVVAGDGGYTAFDNAATNFATWLQRNRVVDEQDMRRFGKSFGRNDIQPARVHDVIEAISELRPAGNQACIVFMTSHGLRNRGMQLATGGDVLTPSQLDAALERGCGNAPTIVIVSGCFSGMFAEEPVARPNRIVLTASSAAQRSFGVGAQPTYMAFDECLQRAVQNNGTWNAVYSEVRECVSRKEHDYGLTAASDPQARFGWAVGNMPLPTRSVAGAGGVPVAMNGT